MSLFHMSHTMRGLIFMTVGGSCRVMLGSIAITESNKGDGHRISNLKMVRVSLLRGTKLMWQIEF